MTLPVYLAGKQEKPRRKRGWREKVAYLAKYDGYCYVCHLQIVAGEHYITHARTRRGEGKRYKHDDCSNPKVSREMAQKAIDGANGTNGAVVTTETVTYTTPTPTLPPTANGLAEQIAEAIKPYVVAQTIDEKRISELIDARLKKALQEAIIPTSVKVEKWDGTSITMKNVHKLFSDLMYLVSKRDHAYLFGDPGSFKSTAARQVAEALGWDYGYISFNPQTPDSRIMGFIDANGIFRDPVFYRLYKNGGIFCIDECDNAAASLLTALNGCLENGEAAFPNGMVKRHENFVLIATGNTAGRGANPMFPERRPFDCAFAERFTYLEWQYDETLERAITLSKNPAAGYWQDWILQVRAFCKKNHPKVLVSPRAAFKGATYILDSPFTLERIADMLIFKGIDKDTRSSILANVPLPVRPVPVATGVTVNA